MMTIRRVIPVLVAVAGMMVAGAALAQPAAANVPTSIRHVNAYPHRPNGASPFLATVACPAGMYVVSAGADHMLITSLSPISPAVPSVHLANFTAVLVTGRPDGAAGNPFTDPVVHAACAPAARLSNAVSVTTQAAPGVDSGTARCPAGLRAFGGGAYYLAPDGHYSVSGVSDRVDEDSVTSDGRGWTFRGNNANARDRLVVTTQCAPLPGSHVATARSDQGFVNVGCFFGDLPLSGGARMVTSQNADGIGETHGVDVGPDFLLVHGYGYNSMHVTGRVQCVPASLF